MMRKETAIKLWEWSSYIVILGATLVFFLFKKNLDITLLLLVVAVYLRVMMYRTKYKACQEENELLESDLRKLTHLLESQKKKEINNK